VLGLPVLISPSKRNTDHQSIFEVTEHAVREPGTVTPKAQARTELVRTAICVQDIDVQCVLQFTLIHAAGCALHRHANRVIHRLEFVSSVIKRIMEYPLL